jgi:2-haloacid dehalogenase
VSISRREFLLFAAGTTLACAPIAASTGSGSASQFKAIAFDGFAIFDPRPVAALAESLFPGKGSTLMDAWRTRQFEYQWLRALSHRYLDFLQATEESLRFAAQQLRLDMSTDQQQQLLSQWSKLPVWPDVSEAIAALRNAGLRLAFLSNMTRSMLQDGAKRARLDTMFEVILSTDQIHTYKPDPRAYRMAETGLKLRREEILFVAFAAWDVAGAKWFGYPTFWLNRLGAPAEELGVEANASGRDLNSLVRFASGAGSATAFNG